MGRNKRESILKTTVHKLIKKEHLGYRIVTNDQVIIETNNDEGLLTIDDMEKAIYIDLTPHTIGLLSELLRYLKTDLEGDK